jgi:hypothetical protein
MLVIMIYQLVLTSFCPASQDRKQRILDADSLLGLQSAQASTPDQAVRVADITLSGSKNFVPCPPQADNWNETRKEVEKEAHNPPEKPDLHKFYSSIMIHAFL